MNDLALCLSVPRAPGSASRAARDEQIEQLRAELAEPGERIAQMERMPSRNSGTLV
jgi:hypothetical protein